MSPPRQSGSSLLEDAKARSASPEEFRRLKGKRTGAALIAGMPVSWVSNERSRLESLSVSAILSGNFALATIIYFIYNR
jgi:hypothetical protein